MELVRSCHFADEIHHGERHDHLILARLVPGIGEITGRSHPLRLMWVELNIDRNRFYPTKTIHDHNMAYEIQRYLYAA